MSRRTNAFFAMLASSMAVLSYVPSAHATNSDTNKNPVETQSFHRFTHQLASDQVAKHTTGEAAAKTLNWVASPVTEKNLCGGYFKEPAWVQRTPIPVKGAKVATTIEAAGPVTVFKKQSTAHIRKDIIVRQPGRKLSADTAYLHRNDTTKHIDWIELIGHVRLQEAHRLVVGTHGMVDLQSGEARIYNALYHLYGSRKPGKKSVNAWGSASKIERTTVGDLVVLDGTYSVCSPLSPSWVMHAEKLEIDKKQGRGKARNAWMHFKGVPVFYTPYYSFPVNHDRKSGFLMPKFAHSSTSGFQVKQPYYFNLAPNYDLTFTANYMSERSLQGIMHVRDLFPHFQGDVYASYLPHDDAFTAFKERVLANYPNSLSVYKDQLNKKKNKRWYFALNQTAVLTPRLTGEVRYNRVGDDYYFQDFDSLNAYHPMVDQLLSKAALHYQGYHWQASALVQAYQTLHRINETTAIDQYQRMPELDLVGSYPGLWRRLNLQTSAQVVHFGYHSNYTAKQPVGERLHIRPGVSLPLRWMSGYVDTELLGDLTGYKTRQRQPLQKADDSRLLPIMHMQSGLYFDRQFTLFNKSYRQSLEPRIAYLYIPYKNQQRYPNYDAVQLPFSLSQLFSVNEFAGYDRIQNENRISIGLNSTIYNDRTATKIFSAGLGVARYLNDRRVCDTDGCLPNKRRTSPIAGVFTYYPWRYWSMTLQGAWDTDKHYFNNVSNTISYRRDKAHLLQAGYVLVRGENGALDGRYGVLGAAWLFGSHWHGFGYDYYDFAKRRQKEQLLGVQYDDCGWSVRVVGERRYQGEVYSNQSTRHSDYENRYFLQLQIASLGNVGQHTDTMLSSIPGFSDPYAE